MGDNIYIKSWTLKTFLTIASPTLTAYLLAATNDTEINEV